MNLVSDGESSDVVLALGIPFQRAKSFQPATAAQEELAREMEIIERCNDRLVLVNCSLLLRIEQIQDMGADSNLAIINTFYHSKIMCSSEHEENVSVSEVP